MLKISTLLVAGSVLFASTASAQLQVVYATSVPDASNWTNEPAATGQPPNNDCNMSSPDYAYNDAGQTYLWAPDFGALNVPGDQVVTSVRVAVLSRFDMNETATMRLRATWTRDAGGTRTRTRDFTITNASGNGNCNWRVFDITNEEGSWSAAELNSMRLASRREGTFSNNRYRVKAFRIAIETEPCSITLECNATANSAGAGTRLQASGTPSLSGSALSMQITGAPAGAFGFTWQGQPIGSPVVSGNGLRCFGGSSTRSTPIWMANLNGNVNFALDLGNPAFAGVMAGDTIILQCVHRDVSGAGFDWSDALRVVVCP